MGGAPMTAQQPEYSCNACDYKCVVKTSCKTPPFVGCIFNSDIGAIWQARPHTPDKPRPPCEECVYQERIDKAARTATLEAREEVLDLMSNYLAEHIYTCRGISTVDSMKMAKYIGSLRQEAQERGEPE
jgi:hypothetical protein